MVPVSCIPRNFPIQYLPEIEREAKDFALINGVGFRVKSGTNDDLLSLAPVTLFPSPFPRNLFDLATSIQPSINLLKHLIGADYQFLSESLRETIKVDDFTANLFKIYDTIVKSGSAQSLSVGLFRSDYMMNKVDETNFNMKQVEMNAISVGFGGVGDRVRQLHMHTMSKYAPDVSNLDQHLPISDASKFLAQGLIKGWELYGSSQAVICFAVENRTINIADQRILEFTINRLRPDIKIIRRNFDELKANAKLKDNQLLYYGDEYEIGVVYFRHGYMPEHYLNEEYWQLRLLIERSKALKCPTIGYHLAGAKKIQQVVAKREILEKFITDKKEADRVAQTFAGLWGLEMNEEGDAAVEMALSTPQRFVLKPQREGGGNNFYDQEIIKELEPIKNSAQRESFILMELIKQPLVPNYILVPDGSIAANSQPVNIVCELGIFGTIVGGDNEIICNYSAGHVLRSKMSGVNEGGIAAGYGALDSPFLV